MTPAQVMGMAVDEFVAFAQYQRSWIAAANPRKG